MERTEPRSEEGRLLGKGIDSRVGEGRCGGAGSPWGSILSRERGCVVLGPMTQHRCEAGH